MCRNRVGRYSWRTWRSRSRRRKIPERPSGRRRRYSLEAVSVRFVSNAAEARTACLCHGCRVRSFQPPLQQCLAVEGIEEPVNGIEVPKYGSNKHLVLMPLVKYSAVFRSSIQIVGSLAGQILDGRCPGVAFPALGKLVYRLFLDYQCLSSELY